MGSCNGKAIRRALAFLIIILLIPTGCDRAEEKTTTRTELFGGEPSEFGNVTAPSDFDWKQCDGTILNFICEDNINANILSKEVESFTRVTGIKVNIKRMDFNTLEEKINMEFISKTAQYELIYVDPYKTLNRFSDGLEDLNLYEQDESLPHIVGGIESFPKEQLEVCSYFEDTKKLDAIPFDSTTMILFYRKDIFGQYQEQMEQELGFDPNPGNGDFTWDQFIEVSKWINEHGEGEEPVHGSLTMSAEHNSIYTAFSTVLGAYGGDYFTNNKIKSLGTVTGFELQSRTEEFTTALKKFKEIIALNPENKEGYTWDKVATLFTEGNIAMMINWDENVSAIENSEIAGKVGYSVLPKGTKRSSNIYGGSGIGINSYASSKKKLAAWMFIVWATSPEVQMKSFMEKEGGTLPTRTALIEKIERDFSGGMPQVSAMIKSQKKEYAYYRPKMKNGYEFEDIMVTNLYDMIQEDRPVKNVSINMKSQWSERR
ncbi:MAG TPA: extracellular solute-binding protein [Clostridiales bacterium]|nr:extracellular solute-binding protein [Clostridiales bacterium]